MKFSLPVLEVALVVSLVFAVPIASVVLDVASMMQSRGHRNLSLGKMIQTAVAPPRGGDLLTREQAARLQREVVKVIESVEPQAFLTSDPHDPMAGTSDPHDPEHAR